MRDVTYYRLRPAFESAAPRFFTPRGEDPVVARHGMNKEIIALMSGTVSSSQVRDFLWRWFSRPEYLAAVARGGYRHDLQGRPAERITEAETQFARARLVERLTYEPLRPGGLRWVARTLTRIKADPALRAEVLERMSAQLGLSMDQIETLFDEGKTV